MEFYFLLHLLLNTNKMETCNSIKVSIPSPCSEDWNKMTPNEKGAFCSKCCKTVVDFTRKTTEEIKNYFTENVGTKTCGRFKYDQLDEKPQISRWFSIPGFRVSKVFVAALLLVFGTSLFSCSGPATGGVETVTGDSVLYTPETEIITKGQVIAEPVDTLELKGDTMYEVMGKTK